MRPVRLDHEGLIDEDLSCDKCGGNLRDWPPDAHCPHCGWPIDAICEAPAQTPDAGPRVLLDAAGALATDHACLRCAYNLRGLRPDGLCPECATPVAISLRSESLRDADADWVDRLARGARWTFGALLAGTLLRAAERLPRMDGGRVVDLLELAVTVAGLIAVWLVTTPEPAEFTSRRIVGWRWTARLGCVGGVIATLAVQILYALDAPPIAFSALFALLYLATAVLCLVSVVGDFALLTVLLLLARRLPHARLRRWVGIMRWFYPGSEFLLVSLLLVALSYALIQRPPPALGWLPLGVDAAASLAEPVYLVVSVACIIVVWKLGTAFREAARAARRLAAGAAP